MLGGNTCVTCYFVDIAVGTAVFCHITVNQYAAFYQLETVTRYVICKCVNV